MRLLLQDADSAVRLAAGVAAVAAGEGAIGVEVVRAAMSARATRAPWRVERLLALMQPTDSIWLRDQLDLD